MQRFNIILLPIIICALYTNMVPDREAMIFNYVINVLILHFHACTECFGVNAHDRNTHFKAIQLKTKKKGCLTV